MEMHIREVLCPLAQCPPSLAALPNTTTAPSDPSPLLAMAIHILDALRDHLASFDPLLLVLSTVLGSAVFTYLYIINCLEISVFQRLKNIFFSYIKLIPYVRDEIKKTKDETTVSLMKEVHGTDTRDSFTAHIPKGPMKAADIMNLANTMNVPHVRYLAGRVSGAVFNKELDHDEMELYKEILAKFAWSNPLWPSLFPGVRKMEAEVVRMCLNLFHGDDDTCGTMSSGGTISIMLACLAHRNRAMANGVNFPEMIVPTSAHAAFFKAGEVFRIKCHRIPLDKGYRVCLRKMEARINGNTCMLAGSAPNFPFGTVDDIASIGALGLKYSIPVHVDACLGGFVLPFLANEDGSIPPFDFRVPGVTSISADTHKYGCTPKGSSVIMYRDCESRKYQYFADADWQGGIYASATMEGSRAGMNIAMTWAGMLYHGKEYYCREAENIRATTQRFRDGLKQIPEFFIRGEADTCVVSWGSDDIDIYRYASLMESRGWHLGSLQFPAGVHIMVTQLHTATGVVDDFFVDTHAVMDEIRASPNVAATGRAKLYGQTATIPDRSLVKEFATIYLDATYSMPPESE